MSHIDDARIEAYVDGAYDALTSEERAEIERRIEEDPAFAARVTEARTLRDRAAAILSLAAPEGLDLPPFEELQRRAAAGTGPGSTTRRWIGLPPLVGLSWAATVVLALGVGWYVGQGAGAGDPPVSAFSAREDAVPTEAEPGPIPQPAEDEAAAAARARQEQGQAAPPDVPQEAPPDVSIEPLSVRPNTDPPGASADATEKAAVEPEARLEEYAARNAPPAVAEVAAPAGASDSPALGLMGDHTLHSLAVPGLDVIGVSLDDSGNLAGLEILHRLPTGDTLSVRYVGLFSESDDPRPGAGERAEDVALPSVSAQIQGAALPAGWRQVMVRKEDRWVVARAPLSEAEIRAYLMMLN